MKEGIRREYKKQYDASTKKIDVVDVPEFNFLMVDGIGNPNVEEFKLKAEALHILSKAIKDYFKEEMDSFTWCDFRISRRKRIIH